MAPTKKAHLTPKRMMVMSFSEAADRSNLTIVALDPRLFDLGVPHNQALVQPVDNILPGAHPAFVDPDQFHRHILPHGVILGHTAINIPVHTHFL